jgi:hypothetical protein
LGFHVDGIGLKVLKEIDNHGGDKESNGDEPFRGLVNGSFLNLIGGKGDFVTQDHPFFDKE